MESNAGDAPRSERLLLIVAHPDDESLGAGILLQRKPDVQVVFCTSGAPNRLAIWRRFGSPWHYARVREREARAALTIAGRERFTFLRFRDGRLYRGLPKLYRRLERVVREWKPGLIVTHAFEGGHQDHDACSFVCSLLAQRFGIAIQEMPLYRANLATGGLIYQTFGGDDSGAECLQPTAAELQTKRKMVAAHESQAAVTGEFDVAREVFRAQLRYDYTKPAIEGAATLAVSGLPFAELAAAFRAFQGDRRTLTL